MMKKRNGITLVEVMVTAAIMVVVITPVSLVLSTGYRNYYVESNTIEAQENTRYAMEEIINTLRQHDSQDISVSPDGELIVIPGTLVFAKQDEELLSINPSELTQTVVATGITAFIVSINDVFDDLLVEIEIRAKIKTGREITLKNSYRIKSSV